MEFNLKEIEKTFVNYKNKQLCSGVVISLKSDGVVFNIGGKLDAYIPKEELQNFSTIKIGDRFSVIVLGKKTEDGFVLASQNKAVKIEQENQDVKNIKLGKEFSFLVSSVNKSGSLIGKLGHFTIVIPKEEICSYKYKNPKSFINKRVEAIAKIINFEQKTIVGSIKILEDRTRTINEEIFWKTNFINKIVDGKVKKIVPYGAFVDVGGVDCLIHISNISSKHIKSADEILKVGETYKFRILEINKETKKVSLGYKQIHDI